MSLKKDFEYKKANLNVHKIIRFTLFDFTTNRICVDVGSFFGEVAKNENPNNYLFIKNYTIPFDQIDLSKDIRKEAYTWLKSNIEMFKTAKDI